MEEGVSLICALVLRGADLRKPWKEASTYNSEGQLTSLTYPSSHTYSGGSWQVVPGRMYVYGFDAMGRPNRMYTTEDRQYDLAKTGVRRNVS